MGLQAVFEKQSKELAAKEAAERVKTAKLEHENVGDDEFMFTQLRKVPLLRNLNNAAVKTLGAAFTKKDYLKGMYVMKQGDPITDGSMFYFLVSGSVSIVINGAVVATRTGIYFGEKGLLEDVPRSAGIFAATDIKCICLTRLDFHTLALLDDRIRKAFDFRLECMNKDDSKAKKVLEDKQKEAEANEEKKLKDMTVRERALLQRMS
jgi:CRP-like cAMP-binding protein